MLEKSLRNSSVEIKLDDTSRLTKARKPPINNCAGGKRRLASLTTSLDREELRSKYNEILKEQKLDGITEKQIIAGNL